MDDNKLLTLANGERIRLQDYCSLLFEVADLKSASPATVSRCGMVYVDSQTLGPEPIWKRWLNQNLTDRPDQKLQLEILYDRYIKNLLNLIYQGITQTGRRPRMKMIVPLSSVNLTVQLTRFLDSCLSPSANNENLHSVFLQSVIWSFGCCLKIEDRVIFDTFVKYLSGLNFDENELLFDQIFHSERNQWIKWEDLIPKYEHNPSQHFADIFVPTIDTIRLEWLIKSMLTIHQPVLFVGDTGTSKTATIQSYLQRLKSSNPNILNLNFSSRTKSIDVQYSIESQLEKRSKNTYGPSAGGRLIVFLDDLSMPNIDQYGTQQVIAFLKLFIEKHGIYERNGDFNWKTIVDIDWIAAMSTPGKLFIVDSIDSRHLRSLGAGNNSLDPRFVSHFCIFYVTSPSYQSLFRIFSTILQTHVQTFSQQIQNFIPNLIKSTLEIYEQIVQSFVRTPTKSFYVFSIRDLSRIIQSLLQTTPSQFDTIDKFLRVWIHELIRVFADRFNDSNDHQLFMQILTKNSLVQTNLLRQPILFADYRNEQPKIYEGFSDYQSIRKIFEEILLEYSQQQSDFVLFNYALEHLTRIYRVLRLDRGHLLLIGTGALGKRSLAKLAAFTAKYQIFEIQLTRNYNENSFRDDLKVLFEQIALKNIKTVFILNDTQIIDENFLEYINTILCNGTIPSLFNDEVNFAQLVVLFYIELNRREIRLSINYVNKQIFQQMNLFGNISLRNRLQIFTLFSV